MILEKKKVAIVGSRDFDDEFFGNLKLHKCSSAYDIMASSVLSKIRPENIGCIISGGAKGADQLAEKFAKKLGIPVLIYLPDWKTYGKQAGFIRNALIVEACNILFAFQINHSKGTQNSIDRARKLNKEVYVFSFIR